ncbi:hypothetical protein GF324_05740, partial [bacterium]|nr:hypothetical protein [bacterium]
MPGKRARELFLVMLITGLAGLFPACDRFKAPEPPKGKPPTLTTSERTEVRYGPGFDYHSIGSVSAGRHLDVLGKAQVDAVKGQKPSWYGQWYRIRMRNGNVGFIPSNAVRHRNPSYIIDAYRSSYYVYDGPLSDPDHEGIRKLEPGERVTILDHEPAKRSKDRKQKGRFSTDMAKVRLEDGTTGWVYTNFIDWGGVRRVPHLNTPPIRYRQYNFKQKTLGWSERQMEERYGPPMSRVKGAGDTVRAYYNNIHLFHGKRLHKETEIIYVDDELVSALGTGKGKRKWIEYLPFAGWLRAQPLAIMMQHFNNWYESGMVTPAWDKEKQPLLNRIIEDWPWWIRIPIYILVIVLYFILLAHILVLPFVLSVWVVGWISSMPVIPNVVLFLLLWIPATAISYLWSVMLMQNIFPFNHAFLIWVVVGLVTWFIILTKTMSRINYGRCPNCYHWAGVGLGSVLLGR